MIFTKLEHSRSTSLLVGQVLFEAWALSGLELHLNFGISRSLDYHAACRVISLQTFSRLETSWKTWFPRRLRSLNAQASLKRILSLKLDQSRSPSLLVAHDFVKARAFSKHKPSRRSWFTRGMSNLGACASSQLWVFMKFWLSRSLYSYFSLDISEARDFLELMIFSKLKFSWRTIFLKNNTFLKARSVSKPQPTRGSWFFQSSSILEAQAFS